MLDTIISMIMDGKVELHQLAKAREALTFCQEQSLHCYDMEPSRALFVIQSYARYKNEMPECHQDLIDFILAVPELTETCGLRIRNVFLQQKAEYLKAIDYIDDDANSGRRDATDWDLALAVALTEARRIHHEITYDTAKKIVAGSVENPKDKNRPWSGVADAKRYIRERMLEDIYDAGSVEGDFRDNLSLVEKDLFDRLEDPDEKRCFTGFPGIDDTQLIGPSQELRTVGIAGFTNQGKSMFMMTMIYNMMRAGKRILLIPLEFPPMEAWKRIAWLHLHYQNKINLPALDYWESHPKEVTPQHQENLKLLIEELKSGKTLPGKLDAYHASTWPEIVELVNGSALPYDVLAVDYIGRLNYEGNDRREAISKIFHHAQGLTQTYKDGKGIVVMTPLQVNKAGFQKAAAWAPDAAEYGVYDGTDVDTFTDAVRDLDLIINVFYHGETLKATATSKISEMKSRRSVHFEPFYVKADRRTRYMRETTYEAHRAEVSANIHLEAQMEDEIAKKKKKGRGRAARLAKQDQEHERMMGRYPAMDMDDTAALQ
jgi:hypothetical protein